MYGGAPLKIYVRLPQVEGALEVGGVAVLFGRPGSGKTWLLKSVYNVLYRARYEVMPTELDLLVPRGGEIEVVVERGGERLQTLCNKRGGLVSCNSSGGLDISALYMPPFAEALVKYRWSPPYESYEEFKALVCRFAERVPAKARCNFGEHQKLAEALGGRGQFKASGRELYEVLENDRELPLRASSSNLSKLEFLEAAAYMGYLEEYDLLLLDNVDAGLHPMALIRLAMLLHNLASCGKKVVAATHSPLFADMLVRANRLNEVFKVNISLAPVGLYAIYNGRIIRHEVGTSFIADFSKYIYAAYLSPEDYQRYLKSAEEAEAFIAAARRDAEGRPQGACGV